MVDDKPPAPVGRGCREHKFIHLETIKNHEYTTHGSKYTKVDRFFCEKCLKEKQIVKTEENRREKPEWY